MSTVTHIDAHREPSGPDGQSQRISNSQWLAYRELQLRQSNIMLRDMCEAALASPMDIAALRVKAALLLEQLDRLRVEC